MRKITLLLLAACGLQHAQAQTSTDTLKNHSGNVTLESNQYSGSDWGFYVGHNSKEQQQFGEKYHVDAHIHVLGVVAYLTTTTGTVQDPNFEIDFRLWGVDTSGLPDGASGLDDGHLKLGNANLGGATTIMFHNETHVEHAFYVSMDLGDYAHDGLNGDTVGLQYAPHGSRTTGDISNTPYRNIFQAHGHGSTPNWKDFYTQFTTPTQIATHFAIYPIVEMDDDHNSISSIQKNGLKIENLYPNPSQHSITLPYNLSKPSKLSFNIMDLSGRVVLSVPPVAADQGSHQTTFNIETLPAGTYLLSIMSTEGAVAIKFNKI